MSAPWANCEGGVCDPAWHPLSIPLLLASIMSLVRSAFQTLLELLHPLPPIVPASSVNEHQILLYLGAKIMPAVLKVRYSSALMIDVDQYLAEAWQ